MYKDIARPSDEVLIYEPFPAEIAAVEQVWNEPIPENLVRIGGVDWWSWAHVEMSVEDQKVIFSGEYRDQLQRYRGQFRYRHPQGTPMPARPFEDYVMSHLSDGSIIFVNRDETVPRDYFYLEPVDPSLIETRGSGDEVSSQ